MVSLFSSKNIKALAGLGVLNGRSAFLIELFTPQNNGNFCMAIACWWFQVKEKTNW